MSELVARLICAKRKDDGTVLLGFEPMVSTKSLCGWLDERDPNWSTSIVPGQDGYVASLTLNGVTRSTVVHPRQDGNQAGVLLELCKLFGLRIEVPDEKIWFRMPQTEWDKIKDKNWTWEEVKELGRHWTGKIHRPRLPENKLVWLRQLIKAQDLKEHEAILLAYENGIIKQFVPGLEMLTEKQADELGKVLSMRRLL